MRIYLVTGNRHKLEEVKEIAKITLGKLAEKLEIEALNLEVEEKPGHSIEVFFLNSYLKAKAGFEKTGSITLGDDSGLVIPALENFPGGLSSRILKELSWEKRNEAISAMVAKLPQHLRKAFFHCSATVFISKSEFATFSGRLYGILSPQPKGDKGFGYDPIFIPEGYEETLAQLGPEVKNAISHRSRAFQSLFEYLKPLIECESREISQRGD